MQESNRNDFKRKKAEENIKRWCEWRFSIFGKIRYKDLIKQIDYYEKN